MQQTLQNDGKATESYLGFPDQPAASTSISYDFSSSLPEHSTCNQYHSHYDYNSAPYPTTKKRVIRVKRAYSIRTRGRSGPLQSLARKLGRFKVRTVVVEEIATEECQQNR